MPSDPLELEYEYRKQRYEAYIKERDALRNDSLEVSDRYDKAILALAGGALALSLTFLEKIAPHPVPWTFLLLAASWLCLIASLLLELYALSTSQTVTNELIEVASEEYRQFLLTLPDQPPVSAPLRVPESREVIEQWKQRTRSLNVWSRWLLTAGIVFLCVFSLANLPYRHPKEDAAMSEKATSPRPLNESKGSYVAPSSALPPPRPPVAPPPPAPPSVSPPGK